MVSSFFYLPQSVLDNELDGEQKDRDKDRFTINYPETVTVTISRYDPHCVTVTPLDSPLVPFIFSVER